ncbi:MAG: hypothetical protein PW790_04595 [Parvibaculaceae bacterium]|nr:hypothetical protein [Parvibaculaceae bacterium]
MTLCDPVRGAIEIARTPSFSYFIDLEAPGWFGWSSYREMALLHTSLLLFPDRESRITACDRLRDDVVLSQHVRIDEAVEIDLVYLVSESPEMPDIRVRQILNLPMNILQALKHGGAAPSWLHDALSERKEAGLPGLVRAACRQPVNLVSIGMSGEIANMWWDGP